MMNTRVLFEAKRLIVPEPFLVTLVAENVTLSPVWSTCPFRSRGGLFVTLAGGAGSAGVRGVSLCVLCSIECLKTSFGCS